MCSAASQLTIGALARAAGVHVETIRFYQRRGLLAPPPRAQGGFRHYGAQDLARLRFIKSAQRLGFSLDEVAELLQLDDGLHCSQASALGARKLADVRQRIADLQRIESALADMLLACSGNPQAASCPLIAALHTAPD